jgi:hypothetical protein
MKIEEKLQKVSQILKDIKIKTIAICDFGKDSPENEYSDELIIGEIMDNWPAELVNGDFQDIEDDDKGQIILDYIYPIMYDIINENYVYDILKFPKTGYNVLYFKDDGTFDYIEYSKNEF